jgi:hypothetical protein
MQAELCDIKRAVASGTRDAGRRLKTELRCQVASVGIKAAHPTAEARGTTQTTILHRGWPELARGSAIGHVPVPLDRRLVRRGSACRRIDQHGWESGDC